MKTSAILLVTICISVFSISLFCGWTGNGSIAIKTGLAATALMFVVLATIIAFCIYQFVHRGRAEWRRNLLRTSILVIGWTAAFYIMFLGTSVAVKWGRHLYWSIHKSDLEQIALIQLGTNNSDGFRYASTTEIEQLGYPVFVEIDTTNSLQIVGFVHWSTAPSRRGGFLFIKGINERTASVIATKAKSIQRMNTNWFEFEDYAVSEAPHNR